MLATLDNLILNTFTPSLRTLVGHTRRWPNRTYRLLIEDGTTDGDGHGGTDIHRFATTIGATPRQFDDKR